MKNVFIYKLIRTSIAIFILFGSVIAPVFADSTQLLATSASFSPTTSMDSATVTSTSVTSTSAADDFMSTGALSLATVDQTAGRFLYVSNSGTDKGTGLAGSAWKSLAYAVSQLKAGDTLNISEGTYQQPSGGAMFKTSGNSDAYITIQGVGNVIIEGTSSTAISGYSVASDYNPAFDTNGQDYIRFNNLTVNNLRDAVEVSPGSSYIEINGLRSDRNHFAVKINGGNHVTVKNVLATNSRNGFRLENTAGIVPTDILFENIDVSGSRDVYTGFEPKYRNGDGFIFEAGNRVTIRNATSHDNWDGGFDLKAVNVLVENVMSYGNKNNFKIWGSGIVVKNALSFGAKIRTDDPVAGEGYGLNARMGQVTFLNSTFVDNENIDIRVDNYGGPANVTFQNCIIGRKFSSGGMFSNDGGTFTDKNNLWYWQGKSGPGMSLSSTSLWADPKFVNWSGKDFHLQSGSSAVNKGSSSVPLTVADLGGQYRVAGSSVDLGAYESGSSAVPVAPVTFNPTPPVAGINCGKAICGIAAGQIVSGTIKVQPNMAMNPDIRKVSYYLNGNLSTREYSAPFIWGGSGFDTTKLADGTYILGGSYTTENSEQSFSMTFIVKNAGVNVSPGNCATAMCGITSGQTVNGVIQFQPNLSLNPDVRKAAYYLNGTLVGREYAPTYAFGGADGFDTSTIANGKYILTGSYTTGSGDTNFTITFTVNHDAVIPSSACTNAICGVAEGQVVSGRIKIQPNLNQNPNIRKVSYYLNGLLISREYSAPFGINAGTGLDTAAIGDGTHILSGSYTTDVGDFSFKITFKTAN